MKTISQLPFASLTNQELYNVLENVTIDHLFKLNCNPITVQDVKYNNELDVNSFYLPLRQPNFLTQNIHLLVIFHYQLICASLRCFL